MQPDSQKGSQRNCGPAVRNIIMRRTITPEEKKILDRHSGSIMTLMASGRVGFSFLTLAIAMAVGCIISAVLAFGVMGVENRWSMAVFLVLPLVLSAIAEILTIRIGTRILRDRLFVAGKTQINGGTIVYDEKERAAWYTEDDLLDAQGRPYRIEPPDFVFGVLNGARLIVAATGEETYLLRSEGELAGLIPADPPQDVSQASTYIGHQNQITFHDDSMPDGEERIGRFFRTYINTSRFRRSLVLLGAGFFGFCGWVIVIFSAYGFYFQYTPAGDRYFMVGLPLIPVLTAATVAAFAMSVRGQIRSRYREIIGVKKVILVKHRYTPHREDARDFLVCELNDQGACTVDLYQSCTGFDTADAARMRPGQTICKFMYRTGNGGTGVFFGTLFR